MRSGGLLEGGMGIAEVVSVGDGSIVTVVDGSVNSRWLTCSQIPPGFSYSLHIYKSHVQHTISTVNKVVKSTLNPRVIFSIKDIQELVIFGAVTEDGTGPSKGPGYLHPGSQTPLFSMFGSEQTSGTVAGAIWVWTMSILVHVKV